MPISNYKNIFDNTTEGIFQTTPEGQYILANPSLATMYGYGSPGEMMEELNDINHQLYLFEDRRKEFINLLQTEDRVVDFESQIIRKDDRLIWIKENARVVRSANGSVLYYEGTVSDITLQKRYEKELLHANEASARFVPDQLLQVLKKSNIAELSLNDCAQRHMTVLFADIRSFTSITEAMTPSESFHFLNNYLSLMGPIIREHGGFIDKYLGDGIMALFETGQEAVRAGMAMQKGLECFNQSLKAEGIDGIKVGIGINSGDLVLGTIGENHRLQGTVIGDTVNLASRIESLTKTYQTPILIGSSTFVELSQKNKNRCRFVGKTMVKGKEQEVELYEVRLS